MAQEGKMCASTIVLTIAVVIVIIGALAWGWIGLFNNNLVDTINNATFKNQCLKRIFYVIVGVSGLYIAWCMISKHMGKNKSIEASA